MGNGNKQRCLNNKKKLSSMSFLGSNFFSFFLGILIFFKKHYKAGPLWADVASKVAYI